MQRAMQHGRLAMDEKCGLDFDLHSVLEIIFVSLAYLTFVRNLEHQLN